MVGLLSAASCARIEEFGTVEPIPETEVLNPPITFHANLNTKTTLNEDKSVSWAAGDKLTVFDAAGNSEEFTVEEDTDNFTFTTEGIIGDGPYYAIAGYGSIQPTFDAEAKKIELGLPGTTTSGSYGEADVIASMTEGTAFSFHHVFVVMKMIIESDDITELAFQAEGITAAGPTSIGFDEEGALDVSYSRTADLVTVENISGAGTFYFAANPGSYSDFTIFVTYKDKKMKIAGSPFTAKVGKILNFGNLEGGTPASTEWTLVTDASTLAVGDQIIIAASNYNYAISTTQNNNNRGQASISKSSDKKTLATDPGEGVQIFTLQNGASSGTFGLYTGSGYIYAASSSNNYLRTSSTLNANASWTVTVTSAGVATITAQGTNSRNKIRYNTQGLFSCYSSGQQDVAIYKKTTTAASGPQMTEVNAFLDQTVPGVYEYEASSDLVTPRYQLNMRDGVETSGRDQYAIFSGSTDFRMQCRAEKLLASVTFSTSSLSVGTSYTASCRLYGLNGVSNGSSSKSFVVKKIEDGKAWLLEEGGALGFIILTK